MKINIFLCQHLPRGNLNARKNVGSSSARKQKCAPSPPPAPGGTWCVWGCFAPAARIIEQGARREAGTGSLILSRQQRQSVCARCIVNLLAGCASVSGEEAEKVFFEEKVKKRKKGGGRNATLCWCVGIISPTMSCGGTLERGRMRGTFNVRQSGTSPPTQKLKQE